MGKTETEIAKRLRDEAETIRHGMDEIDPHKIMRLLKEAADEADRFYNGMVAWKQTAETKDAKLSQEMTDRVNERIAARLAASPDDTKDAARYRWLRDQHIGDDPEGINIEPGKRPGLDAAIDAALDIE
jgi:hypothetical protein